MKERAHGYLSEKTCQERRLEVLRIAKKPCTCKGKGKCKVCKNLENINENNVCFNCWMNFGWDGTKK